MFTHENHNYFVSYTNMVCWKPAGLFCFMYSITSSIWWYQSFQQLLTITQVGWMLLTHYDSSFLYICLGEEIERITSHLVVLSIHLILDLGFFQSPNGIGGMQSSSIFYVFWYSQNMLGFRAVFVSIVVPIVEYSFALELMFPYFRDWLCLGMKQRVDSDP